MQEKKPSCITQRSRTNKFNDIEQLQGLYRYLYIVYHKTQTLRKNMISFMPSNHPIMSILGLEDTQEK